MFRRFMLITLLLLIASLGLATMPTVGSVETEQATILVDAAEVTGTIRSLQGINAGPRGKDRQSHLFRQYEDIGVDYVRTHDYYGPADMRVLFPDLQADPDDESSYDFTSTDRELEAIQRVGAEVLFRLGESWGSPVTYVAPQDHDAWAQAAVHVAMHYNGGWAHGFHWDIEYWEVWNEPDITPFWTGTREEYFQLYEATARALKAYDPTLKVGGPSWCCDQIFFKDFLAYCRDHDVPLDFVSWHYYGGPIGLIERALGVQQALDAYGFTDAENLLTESSSTATPRSRLYLPLILKDYTPTTPTPTPTPTSTPTPSSGAIVLADRPGGLELVSAPVTIPITVGHVTYLPVEVQGYHRPITVTAQTLIHTYVNDLTLGEPGDSTPLAVGVLQTAQDELKLQTLRMRSHPLTLTFSVGQVANLSYTLTLEPAIQPHTPLFGIVPNPSVISGFPLPFIEVWGPDCTPCTTTDGDPPGSTRDIQCAKQVVKDKCNCHRIQQILDSEEESRMRRKMPQMQLYATQFLRSIGGWDDMQSAPNEAPNEYYWDALDWLFYTLTPAERDLSPLASGMMASPAWTLCPEYTNPDGSLGFYDPNNTLLVEQYAANIVAETTRYAPDLRFVEVANEPAAEFYLCPCTVPGGPPCTATSGPNQPACLLGPNSQEFVDTYGDLLFTAADEAAAAMASVNPEALLITGAIELPEAFRRGVGLVLTTEYMIRRGLLTHDNVAIGVHQYPYPFPGWLEDPPSSCAYFQSPDPYWLPEGCETAPPFEDYVNKHGDTVWARDLWRSFDEAVDLSLLLHDAEALGVLDRIYFFDTESHAGWHDYDPTTTLAREAMAGLRLSAINSHQRMLGTDFSAAPSESGSAAPSYNLMVKYLAGVTPVYRWDAPLMDADYSGLVYKLFTRGDEDIIAVWSNAEAPTELTLLTGSAIFKQVTLTRFADAGGPLAISTTNSSAPPAAIRVEPLREFYFLSVISDRPGFGWLAGLRGEVRGGRVVAASIR